MSKPSEAMRDRRTITLGVRVSPEERAAIERAAAREYRRPSDFVRAVILKCLAEEHKPKPDEETLPKKREVMQDEGHETDND